jgi:hypothetical protein
MPENTSMMKQITPSKHVRRELSNEWSCFEMLNPEGILRKFQKVI